MIIVSSNRIKTYKEPEDGVVAIRQQEVQLPETTCLQFDLRENTLGQARFANTLSSPIRHVSNQEHVSIQAIRGFCKRESSVCRTCTQVRYQISTGTGSAT
jgi:hypothetical protein